ncbi:glycosyltransferase family 4 protein [Maribacter cobaltidurans]|uniref:glycosyltransferase family 4 protein n=1 Tax=Maribacter cobaltidurans TaxID=1178778 RepID=UPI0013158712|nr:glycosyltransferase family 4 protein [Maribacter cobaltidurans]
MGSKVHENLYLSLKGKNVIQHIYYPQRKHTFEKIQTFKQRWGNTLITSEPLKWFHKFFFSKKINFLFTDLISKTNPNHLELVHATTLFSDGAIALKIYKKYGTPFIVAIRSTDIDLFLRYRFDLYPLAKEILVNASKLVFVSNSIERNFFAHPFILKIEEKYCLKKKSKVLPNGIDDIWVSNINPQKKLRPHKILYIGKFDYNKNVISLIKAFLSLNPSNKNLQLTLIGSGGIQEKKIIEYSEKYGDSIKFLGPIYDKSQLMEIYRSNHIFAMTSKVETFGLVYLEALSQGLPILYTKNQGIDGTFKENIGKSTNPFSVKSIAEGLNEIVESYDQYELNKINFNNFSWNNIAQLYFELYNGSKNG